MSYIPYALALQGIPYGYWNHAAIPRDDSTPFYATNGTQLPSREKLTATGVSCAGYMNLLRRHQGLPVPGVDDPQEDYPGGTGAWYKFLKPHLLPYDPQTKYEDGTILFRPYTDNVDQGHIALVYDGKILHSYAYTWEPFTSAGTVEPGISYTNPWNDGYFTHVAPPNSWTRKEVSTPSE